MPSRASASTPSEPVLAFHIIFSTYGFWLPNDPRGSNSTHVGALHLRPFGAATKTTSTRSVANRHLTPQDHERRLAAKRALLHIPVRFTPAHLDLVQAGFDDALTATKATLLAGIILPDHVHLVLAKHSYDIERVVGLMKARATRTLRDAGHFTDPLPALRRDATHPARGRTTPPPRPIWGENMRTVFLFTPDQIRSRIAYVRTNATKHGSVDYRILTPTNPQGPTDPVPS